MKADLILTNVDVLTMDEKSASPRAVAIVGERIIAVGSRDQINEYRGDDTCIVDGKGATLAPGFIEAHMHLFGGGAMLKYCSVAGLKGADAIRERVQAYAATRPDDKVIYVKEADYDMLDGVALDRHFLDSILVDRPLAFLAFDIHTMWANTAALEVTDLLHGKRLGPGNEIVMGPDGLATGELREVEAFGPINVYSGEFRSTLGLSTGGEPDPAPTAEERVADRATLRAALGWCARHGITSIQNMDGNLYTLELLDEIRAEGDLICRVKVPFHFKNFMDLDMLDKANFMHERYADDWLTSGLVKAFYDGVMEGYTGYMVDDYADRPGFRGEPLFTQDQFNALAIAADKRGLQIAVHCCGDGAVRAVLDGYEAAAQTNGSRDARHRVEHIEVVHPDDIDRFKQLGAIASMQPPHPPGVMDFPLEPGKTRIGAARWHLSYAWRTLKEAGAHVVFASDWPVARIDVLAGIHAAVTRKPWENDLPDQSFTLPEALAAYTLEGAYAEHAEDRKGRIAPGYLADLVLLTGDITTVAAENIPHMSVAMTICGGRVTHDAL